MTASPASRLTLSPDEYLDWEARQDAKHEFYRGEVFAMAGGTETHARIISNMHLALRLALRGGDCVTYTDALRVHVEAHGLYTYPDLSVVCGEATFIDERRTSLLNPVVLVEVLSPSTEVYDRTTKMRFYRSIPSLETYVLVSQDLRGVDVLTRTDEGWLLRTEDETGRIALPPLGVTLDLTDLYDGVTFPEPGELDRPSPRPEQP
jgi:Uma2 family endonuclease